MKKLAIVMIAMVMSAPAFAQKKGGGGFVDSWTLGLRLNNASVEGVTAKQKMGFQGGVLKHYDWFGAGAATFRTGALLVQRDTTIESGGLSADYTRMDLAIPLTINYAFTPEFSAYAGLDLSLKLSSNWTGTGEKTMVTPINLGLAYDMGSWALGFGYEMNTELGTDYKAGGMIFSGIFEI